MGFKASGLKLSSDFIVTKQIIAALLDTVSHQKIDKSMILSFHAFSIKTSKLSKNALNKIFLQFLSELIIESCDKAVEEAQCGRLTDTDREKMNDKILAAVNELKYIQDISMEIDFLEPMMISILEALNYFQPISEFTRRIIPKISFYCVSEISLPLLFNLILENIKKAGSKLPLLKINPAIKSHISYDSFNFQFLLLHIYSDLEPTPFFRWNIINGPDTTSSTEILINLSKSDDFVPFLKKRPAEIVPVFRKFVKTQKLDILIEILSSNPDFSGILREVEGLKESYEIFEILKEIDLDQSSLETLEHYDFVLGKGDEVFSTFFRLGNIFSEEIFIELNRKIFKIIEEFDEISCSNRKRLLIRIILNLLKCLPVQKFENSTFIDYEPLVDFIISQGDEYIASNDGPKMLKRLFCLPYSKITEPLLIKLWKFYFDLFPKHEAEIWTSSLVTIMSRQLPDNPSINLIKIVHGMHKHFGLEFNELISLILFYSINHEEVAYSREIIHYCKEFRLLNKTQLCLYKAFEAFLEQD